MALGYGYVQRDPEDQQLNWAQIGKDVSDRLEGEITRREEKKEQLDKYTTDLVKELNTGTALGENTELNEFVLNGADEIKNQTLMVNKLLKSGQLKPKDFTIMMQNLVDGTDEAFGLFQNYQDEYSRKMEMMNTDLSVSERGSRVMYDMLENVEGFANFRDHQLIVNPDTGVVGFGKVIDGKVSTKPEHFATAQQLKNRITKDVKQFDVIGASEEFINSLGETAEVITEMGNKYKSTMIKTITGPTGTTNLDAEGNVQVTIDGLLEIIKKESGSMGENAVAGSTSPDPNISTRTVGENQKQYGNKALGEYQIQYETAKRAWDGLKKSGKLSNKEISDGLDNFKYTKENQKRLAEGLLLNRGFENYKQGNMSSKDFRYNLSKEWAMFPAPEGMSLSEGGVSDGQTSYYTGVGKNKSLISGEDFESIFEIKGSDAKAMNNFIKAREAFIKSKMGIKGTFSASSALVDHLNGRATLDPNEVSFEDNVVLVKAINGTYQESLTPEQIDKAYDVLRTQIMAGLDKKEEVKFQQTQKNASGDIKRQEEETEERENLVNEISYLESLYNGTPNQVNKSELYWNGAYPGLSITRTTDNKVILELEGEDTVTYDLEKFDSVGDFVESISSRLIGDDKINDVNKIIGSDSKRYGSKNISTLDEDIAATAKESTPDKLVELNKQLINKLKETDESGKPLISFSSADYQAIDMGGIGEDLELTLAENIKEAFPELELQVRVDKTFGSQNNKIIISSLQFPNMQERTFQVGLSTDSGSRDEMNKFKKYILDLSAKKNIDLNTSKKRKLNG